MKTLQHLASRILFFALLVSCSQVQGQFVDVASSLGLNYTQSDSAPSESTEHRFMTGGAATADFNNDGYADLFVTRLDGPDILYMNDGGNRFIDVSAQAGFDENYPSNGAACGDIDNDGDADLYVTGIGVDQYRLYINDGKGSFSSQAIERNAGIDTGGTHFGFSTAFGDYDSDGYLDLFVSEWLNGRGISHARLLRNEGSLRPGYFKDTTVAAGLETPRPFLFAPRFSDLDNDGHQDLVVAGDFGTSKLFWNNGDGTFLDGTVAANVGTDENGMGLTVGDYNADGQLDFFITAIASDQEPCEHCNWGTSGNRLFQNLGNRQFADVTSAAGVRDAAWGWGTSFLDYDNDGDLDLIATNGISIPSTDVEAEFENQPIRLWRNDSGVFTDVSSELGNSDGVSGNGKGLLVFDFDNDGDIDVFAVNNAGEPVLLRNDFENDNDWLRLNLQGIVSNRDGIGAKITVTPDTNAPAEFMYREVDGGSNFLGQNELTAHFGLAKGDETVDLIQIVWPSGQRDTLSDVERSSTITVVEGESLSIGDFDGDGNIDIDDIKYFAGNLNQAAVGELARLDLNEDGQVTLTDHDLLVTSHMRIADGQTGTWIGDINLDGKVDILGDGLVLMSNLGSSSVGWDDGNLNADGKVNVLGDAFRLIENLGKNKQLTNGPATSAIR